MSQGTIHVSRESVLAYGRAAQDNFGLIHAELVQLVNDAVEVTYYGENAVQFKTTCGQIAVDFANALGTDMRAIAEAVQTSTTAIRAALGGDPVTITLDTAAITAPAVPPAGDAVGVDEAGLEALKGLVAGHCGKVQQQFDDHLAKFTQTDWHGTAKDNGVQAISSFTGKAKAKIDEAGQKLTTYIDQQIEAVRSANH